MDLSFISVLHNLSAIVFLWSSVLLVWGVGLGTFLNRIVTTAEAHYDSKCHGKRLYLSFIWAANIGLVALMVLSPIVVRWVVDSLLVINVFLSVSLGTCSYHIYQWWTEHKSLLNTTTQSRSSTVNR